MKTKITILILIVLILVCACASLACAGNMEANHGYEFNRAILRFSDGDMEIQIRSWYNYKGSDMVQITAIDGTVYYTHGSNVILIYDND